MNNVALPDLRCRLHLCFNMIRQLPFMKLSSATLSEKTAELSGVKKLTAHAPSDCHQPEVSKLSGLVIKVVHISVILRSWTKHGEQGYGR